MGKFIKTVGEFLSNRKTNTFMKAKALSTGVLETSFYFLLKSIDSFIAGNPNKKQVAIFQLGVIPSIEGNPEKKYRCKKILHDWKKFNIVSISDVHWLKNELKPFFENSLFNQTQKTIDALNAVNDNKINEFLKRLKKEKELKGEFK